MKIITRQFTVTFTMLLTLACSSTAGWSDLSGDFAYWNQIGDANWRLEEGAFVADSGNGHLVTRQSYEDFEISLEFWVDEPANSGVFLRASDPGSIADSNSYEANIFDTRPDQTYRTGGIVNFAAPTEVINTGGKWNTYEISAIGDHLVVKLNGITTVDIEDSTYSRGPISLQYGAGVVKFRNIKIKEIL